MLSAILNPTSAGESKALPLASNTAGRGEPGAESQAEMLKEDGT